ncbi:MAG: hypothetical protein IT431_13295 [Phycisphaerales bacterium]|nr:hypothetical protein [Phycisphaerales bacterium]
MAMRASEFLVCACLAALLAGCEGPRAARVVPAAGGTWEAVLPGARVAELGADRGQTGWPAQRNDGQLNPRSFGPVLATGAWPEPERPSVRRPVFVRTPRQAESYLYYRTEERYEYQRGWRR